MAQINRKIFVMGDLHGAYIALLQCLKRSGFDYENDILIQLGDVADGHPQVYECVEELLKIKHLISIRGNHDAWFQQFIETDLHPVFWQYGGESTIKSYLRFTDGKQVCFRSGSGFKTSLNSSDIPVLHRQFFTNQKLFHITDDNSCFIHGGFDRFTDFYKQKESTYYWDRLLWSEALSAFENGLTESEFEMVTRFKQVFLGHTPTTNWGTDQPMKANTITNMDTGAGWDGRLTIMDINTHEYWQSDQLTRLYPTKFNDDTTTKTTEW